MQIHKNYSSIIALAYKLAYFAAPVLTSAENNNSGNSKPKRRQQISRCRTFIKRTHAINATKTLLVLFSPSICITYSHSAKKYAAEKYLYNLYAHVLPVVLSVLAESAYFKIMIYENNSIKAKQPKSMQWKIYTF